MIHIDYISQATKNADFNSLANICEVLNYDINFHIPNVIQITHFAQDEFTRIADYVKITHYSNKNSSPKLASTTAQAKKINDNLDASNDDENVLEAPVREKLTNFRCFYCKIFNHYARSCANKFHCR